MKPQGIRTIRSFAIMAAVATLAACSAGGKSSTDTSNTTPTPTASDLVVALNKSQISSTGSDSATITVTAVDANRNAVGSIPVTITPDNNAVISTSGTSTDTKGVVTGTLGIGSDHSNRTIDVVVTSGSIKKTVTIDVTGASLQASVGSATPGSTSTIQYHLVDGANNDIANAPISVTLASQSAVSGTTDGNGKYTFSYTVPNTATVSVIAKAGGVETDSTVTTTSATTAAATGTVISASLSANPSNIPINVGGSTANQVDVRALFVGASNAPIQYARVRFDLDGDVNGIGGTLTSGSGYVYSDANGVARTSYIPGSRSSGNQALTIRACWSETDFAANTCPNSVTAQVTVVANGVSIAILTNGLIATDNNKSIYSIDFAVQVVDSVGQPITGATVAGSIDLPRFYRGEYSPSPGVWTPGFWDNTGTVLLANKQSCDNEDVNRNDVMEVYGPGQSEDMNNSTTLEPFKASVAIIPKASGSNVTDSFGKAYFTLQYGQNYASWEDVVLTFGTTVQGTEGRNSYTTTGGLPVPAATLTTTNASPPFQISPYNFAPSGQVPAVVGLTKVTDPASGKFGQLCQAQP